VRRLVMAVVAAPLVAVAGLALAGTASATVPPAEPSAPVVDPAETTDASLAPVDVLQVTGLFDGVVVDAIDRAIDRAVSNGSQALILQINTGGAVASSADMRGLIERVAAAPVPIGIWIGPAGSARIYGLPAQLMAVADVTAMVSGSRMGYTGRLLEVNGEQLTFGAADDRLRSGSLSFQEARTLGALKLETTDLGVPTIRSMVLAMDGVEADGVVLDTASEQVNDEGQAQQTLTTVRFSKLTLGNQLMHTVASPPVAYLLFIIGVALLIFELFTAGVGVAGVVGAVCAFLGCFGLAELPARGWAVALLVVAMVAFAVDVQVGVPRFWTGVGLVLTAIGSFWLYEPLAGTSLRLGWLTLVVGIGGCALAFIVGMPSMVRTRFATPTIGREWMIGSMGAAVGDIDPDGVVMVEGSRWRARTNRATPVKNGDRVRVVAIDGVTLEVEPEQGAARDYREQRRSASAD
jgi:membrane-bound serine protease (ClpP class)